MATNLHEMAPHDPEGELMVPVGDEPAARPAPDDPDFISEEGDGASRAEPYPAAIGLGSPRPIFVPKESTPLEGHEADGVIPHPALWAMKYLRHGRFWGGAEATVRECYGSGDSAVYVLDDDRKHCVIARQVGSSPDGCIYVLVGRITIAAYEGLVDGDVSPEDVFNGAGELNLCVVYEAVDAVSNVAVVASFDTIDEVPTDYLPPSPAVAFSDSSDSEP